MTITIPMTAPGWASSTYILNGWQQSGTTYNNVVPGATVKVDSRDLESMLKKGFVVAGSPSES